MSKHLKLNLSFYCLLLTAAFIINHVENRLFHQHLLFIVSFNIIVDIIFRWINSNLLSYGVEKIITSTIFRIIFSLIFIFLYKYIFDQSIPIFIINFLVVYLLFIIFEITILLLNLRHIK